MSGISVLYVIGGLGRGGAEKQLYLLLKYMDRDVFTPAVVSLSTGGVWAGRIRSLGVSVIELPRQRSFELKRLLALFRVIKQKAPLILQTFLFADNAYGLLAGRLARVPILIASRRIDQYGDHRGVLQRLNRSLGHQADAIICNAERSRRFAPPSLAHRHVVIRNGIEPLRPSCSRAEVRQSHGLSSDTLVVGNVGRLVSGKNHDLFIEVAAEVVHVRRDTVFLLVGGGPLEPYLRSRVQQLGLEDKVILTGERGDVADLIGSMDVFMLTSDREGMSNALMEAMAAGLPCVATDVGGNDELVVHGETGYLCPQGNKARLIESICWLLDDPKLRRRLGTSSRTRMAKEFSVESMATATQTLYKTLLDTTSGYGLECKVAHRGEVQL